MPRLRLNDMDPTTPAAVKLLSLSVMSMETSVTRPHMPPCRKEMGSGKRALFFLEIPPFLFGRIPEGIAKAGTRAAPG